MSSIYSEQTKTVRLYQLHEVKKIVDQLGFDTVLDQLDLDDIQNYIRLKKLSKINGSI